MSDAPLVKSSMKTNIVSWKYIQNHFNKGIKFYEQYIKEEQNLTYRAETTVKELKRGYEGYKEHIVKSLINSYIIAKLKFTGNKSDFAGKKNVAISNLDSLTSPIRKTEGYICFMEMFFQKSDIELNMFIPTIASENLDNQIDEILNYNNISSSEAVTLGIQLQESLDVIKRIISHNRQIDFRIIKERYDKVKNDYSLEHKAKMLIDLELRNREIAGREYNDKSEFTVNNSNKQLKETIGMEDLICKLYTKELETLFEQFKSLEE